MNNEFEDLFVLDLANNHQGDVGHAKTIIKEMSEVVKKYRVRAAIKFQFRDLDTYIHKHERCGDNRMANRFLTTRLKDDQFFELKKYAASLDLLSACTPFDEISVRKVVKMSFDYIKIASCSARDWPLVEKIGETRIPLIASTGGLNLKEIDKLVYFLSKRRKDFALMHCVSVYPVPDELLNLGRISVLSRRYPDLAIGWSTHENPRDYQTIALAYSLGARVFEKHIGKNTKKYGLNRYSATKEDVDRWLKAFIDARKKIAGNEVLSLRRQAAVIDQLGRGSFAKRDLRQNMQIKKSDFYFAFPCGKNSIACMKDFESVKTRRSIRSDGALTRYNTTREIGREGLIEKRILALRAFVMKNNFRVCPYNYIEILFPRGLDKASSTGAYFIDFSKEPYIKKIIVMLPGQGYPAHRHADRDELFTIISGNLRFTVDGKTFSLKKGQHVVIDANRFHEFSTRNGVIFEEVSYTKNRAKTEYKNPVINGMDRSDRVVRIEEKIL